MGRRQFRLKDASENDRKAVYGRRFANRRTFEKVVMFVVLPNCHASRIPIRARLRRLARAKTMRTRLDTLRARELAATYAEI